MAQNYWICSETIELQSFVCSEVGDFLRTLTYAMKRERERGCPSWFCSISKTYKLECSGYVTSLYYGKFHICKMLDAGTPVASRGTYLKWTTARWQFATWDDYILSTTAFDQLMALKENNRQLSVMVSHTHTHALIFKSTLRQSRPNKAGLKCPSVRTYVRVCIRSQKVCLILIKFGMWVEVDEWCTTICTISRSKVKVKVTSPSKLEIRPFSKAISFAIYNVFWQLNRDS